MVDESPGRHDSLRASSWRCANGAKVLGDVDVGVADLHGPIGVKGKLTADRLTVDGSLSVMGALTVAGPISVRGELRVDGPISAGTLELDGNAMAGAALVVNGPLVVRGRLTTTSDVRAGAATLDGEFTVPGDVTATSFDAHLRSASSAASLNASTVRVRVEGRPFARRPEFAVLRIEAGEADLEGVRCEYIRADRISLGPETHISRYDGTIVGRHRSAYVGPESESPPPYGLTR